MLSFFFSFWCLRIWFLWTWLNDLSFKADIIIVIYTIKHDGLQVYIRDTIFLQILYLLFKLENVVQVLRLLVNFSLKMMSYLDIFLLYYLTVFIIQEEFCSWLEQIWVRSLCHFFLKTRHR